MSRNGADKPPASTEVVIVGGGVAGVATAWYLQAAGVPFVLCEKGRVAGEQSSRNWGWIRKQGRDPRELPLMILSLRLWHELAGELEGRLGFREAGVTYLIENDADAARFERWLEHAKAFQLDSRLLSRAETERLVPGLRAPHQGSLYTASDCRAEPGSAVAAMAAGLREAGAEVREGCAVRGVETAGGRVAGVVTEHGRIACRTVVVAGGAWSSLLLRRLGIDLPQLRVVSSVQRTTAAPLITESAVGSRGVSMRRRADGGYSLARTGASRYRIVPDSFRHFGAYLPVLRSRWRELKLRVGLDFFHELADATWRMDGVSPFERTRVLDPAPDAALLDDVLACAKRYYPQLAEVHPLERWGGVIDVLPDEVPVLGPVSTLDGLLVVTGFSGHGFGIGPGAGYVTAQLARGIAPAVDLAPFQIERFGRMP